MASTHKNLSPNDKISTKTLLHEAIPLTGTIVSGTYGTANIKNYSHGMFQSVFDYPYLSSSANHIFDITTGFANDSDLSASSPVAAAQQSKKINIYNQMAQVLVGYDKTGSIQQFDEDGDLSAGTKLKECTYLSFSRLLVKDEIKRGSFKLTLGVNSDYTSPFTKTIIIEDHKAETNYKINSPVGEYGILYASNSSGQTNLDSSLHGTGDFANHTKCGLIYYQAGVIALSSSVFETKNSAAATATITCVAEASLVDTKDFKLTDAAGVTTTYNLSTGLAISNNSDAYTPGGQDGKGPAGTITIGFLGATSATNVRDQIITRINAGTGIGFSAAAASSNTITLTQGTAGSDGNTTVTQPDGATGLTITNFSGGGNGNGILLTSNSTPKMKTDSPDSIRSILTGSSISGSADALRHRIQNIQFNNTVELNSSIYFCRINHNEYNYSANPTYLSASQIRVKEKASDVPVSYITTVGLYSADNQLLAVGKLSEPLRKDPTIEYTLRARLDY